MQKTFEISGSYKFHCAVWSKKNGDDLKKIVTERFASSTVFLSLLFSSEMGVLYSPSDPGKDIRSALELKQYATPDYWLGVALCFSVGLNLLFLACTRSNTPQPTHRFSFRFQVGTLCFFDGVRTKKSIVSTSKFLPALVANFTAMAVFSSLSKENAPVGKFCSALIRDLAFPY